MAGDDDQRLAEIGRSLADRVEVVVPGWIERLVVERLTAWRGEVPEELRVEAVAAGVAARDELMPVLRELLAADVDEQSVNPLALLRAVTGHAHEVLEHAAVPPVDRDPFAERTFPDDAYDLVPATWGDIDPDLHELGIAWGAAKAFVHRARHGA